MNASNIAGKQPSEKARIIGDYKILSKIGSGSFATVWKAVHIRTGLSVAVKAINREKIRSCSNGSERFDSEINVMLSMRHDNIVKLLGIHRSHRHIYLIIEYCEQDLSAYIRNLGRPLNEAEAARLLRDLLSGLQFLHSNNLAHRDLKPQNLLLANHGSTLKIADFGLARDIGSESMAETICGSPLYMAPEILRNDSYDARAADIWSVGAILYEMLTRRPPYSARNTIELLNKIESSSIQIPSSLSTNCKSLITGLLNRDAKSRFTLAEIQSHPFFTGDQLRNSMKYNMASNRRNLDDIGFLGSTTEDIVSDLDAQNLINLICELGENTRDQPEIALALFTRCIEIMVGSRQKGRQPACSIDMRFDSWMAQRIDQINVQCRRLISAYGDFNHDLEINVEHYLYEKSLEMARDAAVGELMRDSANTTLMQLRKATLLLKEVLSHVQDVSDARAVHVLVNAIQVRIVNLISRSDLDGCKDDH